MSAFELSQNVGDIVSIMPKASDVFRDFRIDFCCGGNRPLADVIREQKLNEGEVLRRLDEAYEETRKIVGSVDYLNMKSGELIEHIVNKHHAFLRQVLPELSELTTKILRAHGPNHSDLFHVHKLFHTLKTELEQHLIKEEEILFPLIKEYEHRPSEELRGRILKVMKETEDEHENAGGVLKELRNVTKEYEVPEDGCGTYCKTFDRLQELESDLFQHIHLENNILFRRITNKGNDVSCSNCSLN